MNVICNSVLSIRSTVAVALHGLPTWSVKWNVKLPLPVKVWVLVPTMVSLQFTRLAITSLLVAPVVE